MHPAPLAPKVHLFVCANRRSADSPLGPGCGDFGEAVYARLKTEVTRRARVDDVWVTRTLCLGVCPRRGATVAVYPRGGLFTEVLDADAAAIFGKAVAEGAS